MNVIFRDVNPEVVGPVREAFPEWDVACRDIWDAPAVDIIVSPANVTGRMDGGIDQIYINRFGWQLEKRLMRDIVNVHDGRLPIGQARLITTYDVGIPLMICAPTMEWPPGNVAHTDNAYLAFEATLECALTEGVKALGREPTLLVPGLATATGRMPGYRCAEQMRRAWDEVWANPPRPLGEWFKPEPAAPLLGQFRVFPGENGTKVFAGRGEWLACDGSLTPISKYPALHELLERTGALLVKGGKAPPPGFFYMIDMTDRRFERAPT